MIIPAGMIMIWPGTSVPSGWSACDGSLFSKIEYPDLFQVLLYNHGGTPGGEFFGVPDLRGCVPIGVGPGPYGWIDHSYSTNVVSLTSHGTPKVRAKGMFYIIALRNM